MLSYVFLLAADATFGLDLDLHLSDSDLICQRLHDERQAGLKTSKKRATALGIDLILGAVLMHENNRCECGKILIAGKSAGKSILEDAKKPANPCS